ncbi:alpha/beta hydrolase family protein [Bacillus sp. NPDC077027]|uniref:alpha/beta hydrolase family protein n=1 Tax=Bacillus sp. NPDC077027 TaxID=3390548 RepID=UPI003D01C791
MKKRRWLIFLIALIAMASCVIIYENSFDMTEKQVTIHTKKGKLSAVLTTPAKERVKGIVLFVHGDGAQNALYDGGYRPLMERFAKQGYASISWDKPGVGQSEGNWLYQSMNDRAKEVGEVIDWAKKQKNIQSDQIVLWGASQAGWVIPKVAAERTDIEASILVAPAVNWLRQGRYYTIQRLKSEEATDQKIQQELKREDQQVKFLLKGVAYKEYVKKTGENELTKDRYMFIQKNVLADSTEDLKKVTSPIHLVLARQDRNVDSQETKKRYQQYVPKTLLTVKTIENVEHSMLNPVIQHSKTLTFLAAALAPKDLLISKDYLNYCEELIKYLR